MVATIQQDYIINGSPVGDTAQELAAVNWNSGLYRPFLDKNGRRCVTVNVGKHYDNKLGIERPFYETMTIREALSRGYNSPVLHNATLLRKQDWIMFDRAVVQAARPKLRVWSDLAAANTYSLDGMANKLLESETINDPGAATVSMSTMAEMTTDAIQYQLEGMPLPITSMAFNFDERDLTVSRAKGTNLSTLMASIAGRRIAETIEKTTLGVTPGIIYGTSANYSNAPQVVGYLNCPDLNSGTVTTPTGSNSATTVSEVLAIRTTLYDLGFDGPFVVYNGTDWDRYLDDDHFKYVTSGGAAPTTTLRNRLRAIDDIVDVRRSSLLTPTNTGGTFDLIVAALSNPETARAVIGMPLRTIQWESHGGARLNFKVMCIMAPQIRSDFSGNCAVYNGYVT